MGVDDMTARESAAAKRAERYSILRKHAGRELRLAERVPCGTWREPIFPAGQLRASSQTKDGDEWFHVEGQATVFNRPYEMWDEFGPYNEVVMSGAADTTLAADPDVAFLVNHRGVTMARTTSGRLQLRADDEALNMEAWLNPKRSDVALLMTAIEDKDITEMSFAFMIEQGWWSDDFLEFRIEEFDINRGDVSAVNYGANPYTSIAARSQEIMSELDRLPAGAAREALRRLRSRGVTGVEVARAPQTERVAVSAHVGRLEHRVARTTARLIEHLGHERLANVTDVKLPWYAVHDEDIERADHATMFIYDEIGGSFGTTAKSFVDKLEAIDKPTIRIRINSPGGSCRDAVAIYNALKQHPARIITIVDSWAVSAASVIAMAGDEVIMMAGSQLMIHDASMLEDGQAKDHEQAATFLHRQSDNIAEFYQLRAGGTIQEWRDHMLAETWMFAREAVAMGLADRFEERKPDLEPDIDDLMTRSFDFGQYRYTSRRAAPEPKRRTAAPTPKEPDAGQKRGPVATVSHWDATLALLSED